MNYFGMIGAWQLFLIFIILGIIPTFIALIDIVKNDFKGNNKVVWLILVLFGNLFGTLLYFTIGRKQKLTETS
jgi:hypothetical protein